MIKEREILVVDDSFYTILFLNELLTMKGYHVVTANSGAEGLQKLGIRIPDLVLLDLMMPGMDGYQVLQLMKGNPLWQNTPVIILSACADPNEVNRTLKLGAFAFLAKPVVVDELLDRIESAFKGSMQDRMEAAFNKFV